MTWHESMRMVLEHTRPAFGMAMFFGAGVVFAFPAFRRHWAPLLAIPRWFAGRLERIMRRNPSRLGLAVFIFLFNGSIIFLYMLTGLVPGAPLLVAFLTGMNVALAALLGKGRVSPETFDRPLPFSARLCAVLTFCLELPCFWYAMALGWTIKTTLVDVFQGVEIADVQVRVLAYRRVILPLLAVSAVAEAHAVVTALRRAAPPHDEEDEGPS